MTDPWQMLVILLLAANPAGAAAQMASLRRKHEGSQAVVAGTGLAAAIVAVVVAAVVAQPLFDMLDVQPPTFRIAAGIALALQGVQMTWRGAAVVHASPDGWQAGVYPLAIPLVAGPGLLALVLNWRIDPEGGWIVLAVALPAVVISALAGAFAPAGWRPIYSALARATGAVVIVTAAALIVDGVQSV
ncbi:MAG: MarC family protein [Dehalococcoidia bacterium]|nr:MarC family protein [Dehalococcoidia bacterium]